ncbi:MAG: HD domain-containing protein [Fibrobacter sp.]|nr:HD domain-containing protein [Fibrobacter sp.]
MKNTPDCNLNEIVRDTLESTSAVGFVYISGNLEFKACNGVAKGFFPQLSEYGMCQPLSGENPLDKAFLAGIADFENGAPQKEFDFFSGDVKAVVLPAQVGGKRDGYLFCFRNAADARLYLEQLHEEKHQLRMDLVSNKIELMAMQEQMIMNMALMVESRDVNTGGHIKRTSGVVRILVAELRKDPDLQISGRFAKAVEFAAPMHDMGKIAIDDSILRKPGKFTDEEFAVMKTHAEKGGQIVSDLLSHLEDKMLVEVAKNVANYHHERFDGSGYPRKLKGEEIPLEARIMAIADVYDALVSKRCYKDEFPFDKAFSIIVDSMGTHFDPKMKNAFVNCREWLEDFYRKN